MRFFQFAKVREGHIKIREVISPNIEDVMLVSWADQKELGVLHDNWLHVLSSKRYTENEERYAGVRTEGEGIARPQEWPKEVRDVFEGYKEQV